MVFLRKSHHLFVYFVQIKVMKAKLTETLEQKQSEANEFQRKHQLTSQSGGPAKAAAEPESEGSAQGVLI